MPTKSTNALAVKKFLIDLYEGMPTVAQDEIQVSFSWPGKDIQRRWAMFAQVEWSRSEWVTNRSREEEFSVQAYLCVQIIGGSAEDVESFAIAMAHDFEQALHDDPGMSGLCVTSGFNPTSLKSWPIDKGYEAQFEISVDATCRPSQ